MLDFWTWQRLDEVTKAHETLFQAGMKLRWDIFCKEYVEFSLKNRSLGFLRPIQELVTDTCSGSVWLRPGLERKHRSLLNVAILCAMHRSNKDSLHFPGAVYNGASAFEIRETLLQASVYASMPVSLQGF